VFSHYLLISPGTAHSIHVDAFRLVVPHTQHEYDVIGTMEERICRKDEFRAV